MATTVNKLFTNMIDAGFDPSVDLSGLAQAEIHPTLIFSLNNWNDGTWNLSLKLAQFNAVVFSYLQRLEDLRYGQVHIANWQQLIHVITKLNMCNPNAFICWNYQPWQIEGFPFMDLLPTDKHHVGMMHFLRCSATRQLPQLKECARLLTFINNCDYRSDVVMKYAYEFYVGGKFNPLFSTLYVAGKVWFADLESLLAMHPNIHASQLQDYFPTSPVSIKVLVLGDQPAIHHTTFEGSEDDNSGDYISSDEMCDSDPGTSSPLPIPNYPVNVYPDAELLSEFKIFLYSNKLQQKDVSALIQWSQSTISEYVQKKPRSNGWNVFEQCLRSFMYRYNKPFVY